MARPRAPKLETIAARRRLGERKRAYYVPVSPGILLGYRRCQGPGSWSVRCTTGGGDWVKRIALADDFESADNKAVLTYWQAIDAARALARGDNVDTDHTRPLTVSEALDRYEADLRARGADAYNARRPRLHLSPSLLSKPVSMLTARELLAWRDGLVAKGVSLGAFNRMRVGLRAALEFAATLDHRVKNRDAFRQGLKGLPGANKARRLVLPDSDVRKLVRAGHEVDRYFGIMVEVLAQTGARFSQAARLRCGDLQIERMTLLMPSSFKGKRQKARSHVPVPITEELAATLAGLRGSRHDDEPLLLRADGASWRKTLHRRLFREVAARAGFDPDQYTSYCLRHSSICRALQRGLPVTVVGKLHDTSGKEIESHYAAFILDHVDALARRALLQTTEPPDTVLPLARKA